MRQEWAWLLREQEMFYDEFVGYKLLMPRRLASQMPKDMINELRKALNRIREENNQMKMHLNRYRTQVKIRESVEWMLCILENGALQKDAYLCIDVRIGDITGQGSTMQSY
ncbi:hypothetical protein SO802_002503 [Lithocarpus litseifolius]|uniref:Uncharacterized protein n=1 Tax=Lithocarpus litseifolius TaxID=425828 RepID=A0AAW2DZA4_9ROSI